MYLQELKHQIAKNQSDRFKLVQFLHVMEHKGAGGQQNWACKKLHVEADTKNSIIDVLSHVCESDSVEPGAGAAVNDDHRAHQKTGDEEKPSSSRTTKAARLPVFHDEKEDADKGDGDWEHGCKLNDKQPYWSFHEFSRVVKAAVDEPSGVTAVGKKAIMAKFVRGAIPLNPDSPIRDETAQDVDDKS